MSKATQQSTERKSTCPPGGGSMPPSFPRARVSREVPPHERERVLHREPRKSQSGQAAVESAIVLPLFVFLILGILQLGLMHQARLMTKYAAYKAVRAGSIHNASVSQMERAALAVLLPLVSKGQSGGEYIKSVTSASEFRTKWLWPNVMANQMLDAPLKHAQVTICGPLRNEFPGSSQEVDFDDPANAANQDWQQGQRTKLRVQVTFNYRMPIPFANWVIHAASRNREITPLLRMTSKTDRFRRPERHDIYNSIAKTRSLYILPIRATYTMRMQSNFYLRKNPLPSRNECVFAF